MELSAAAAAVPVESALTADAEPLLEIVLIKPDRNAALGLQLSTHNGHTTIFGIRAGAIAAKSTQLTAGMILLSVNNESVKDHIQCTKMLATAVGEVKLVLRTSLPPPLPREVILVKPEPSSKLGVQMTTRDDGLVVIFLLRAGSIGLKSGHLKLGLQVLEVNGTCVTGHVQCAELMAAAVDEVRLLVVQPPAEIDTRKRNPWALYDMNKEQDCEICAGPGTVRRLFREWTDLGWCAQAARRGAPIHLASSCTRASPSLSARPFPRSPPCVRAPLARSPHAPSRLHPLTIAPRLLPHAAAASR